MLKATHKTLLGMVGVLSCGAMAGTALADKYPPGMEPLKTDSIILKYHHALNPTSKSAHKAMLQSLSTAKTGQMKYVREVSTGAHVIKLDEAKSMESLENLSKSLSKDSRIAYAVPNRWLQKFNTPDDPRFNEQWHYTQSTVGINLDEAWSVTTGSEDVVVAVIDTGVRPHQDLKAQLLPGYDFISEAKVGNDGDGRDDDAFDPGDWMAAGECGQNFPPKDYPSSWHGTHVAGTIAATANNGIGVTGVAPGTKILPVRVLGKCGGQLADILDGMRWSAGLSVPGVPDNPNPAKVINLSLGGFGFCDQAYNETLNEIADKNVMVVAAAGNSQFPAMFFMPANCEHVITVASTNRQGQLAFYSNFGPSIDIAAPGGETRDVKADGVLSTGNTGEKEPGEDNYVFYQGTSMASPHVAGVVALMSSVNEDIGTTEVLDILGSTATAFPPNANGDSCYSFICGVGIMDAGAAVKEAKKRKQ